MVLMANEEQIGFHKGSITVLAKEREELLRMVNVVEQLIEMHVKSLKELGVDLEKEAKKVKEKIDKKDDLAGRLA